MLTRHGSQIPAQFIPRPCSVHDRARADPLKTRFFIKRTEILVGDEKDAPVYSRFLEARDVFADEVEADVFPAMIGRDADGVDADGGGSRDVRGHRCMCKRVVGGKG